MSIVFLASCSVTPEKKAKELIEVNLKQSLHDWNSYEPVKYSKLDSLFTRIYDHPEYKQALEKAEFYSKQIDEYEKKINENANTPYGRANYNIWYETQVTLLDSAIHYVEVKKRIDSLFVPQFDGWRMQHSYRANNAMGNKVITHRSYFFDKDINQIIKVEDL